MRSSYSEVAAETTFNLSLRNTYVKVIKYENRPSWFPCSIVFGMGVSENRNFVRGICPTF